VRSSERRKPVHNYAKLDSAGWACSDGEVDEQAEEAVDSHAKKRKKRNW
jgi:hypothetical protein